MSQKAQEGNSLEKGGGEGCERERPLFIDGNFGQKVIGKGKGGEVGLPTFKTITKWEEKVPLLPCPVSVSVAAFGSLHFEHAPNPPGPQRRLPESFTHTHPIVMPQSTN